ncbi:MAG: exodeoxyribonuclease V subunit gamma, partial [Acidimicrobiales bacterium]
MTFVLHRGERADVLASALAGVLADAPADPFTPEVVAVHSRGVERWLSHHLAARLGTSPWRADGVCANVGFPFPGRLVGDALARATGVERAADPWRPERLAWPLLGVVDASQDEPWLAVLAAFLGGADPASPDRDRRFGAVRHVADLLDRYAVHRPAMVLAWAGGADEDGSGQPLPADVAWQAQLWRRLREGLGTPSPAERLVEGCAALVERPGLVDLPARLSLFGFTRLPASYLDVLAALAAHRHVHLLTLHPSSVAWNRLAAAPTADPEVAAAALHHP